MTTATTSAQTRTNPPSPGRGLSTPPDQDVPARKLRLDDEVEQNGQRCRVTGIRRARRSGYVRLELSNGAFGDYPEDTPVGIYTRAQQ
jgi:hypothetical protein